MQRIVRLLPVRNQVPGPWALLLVPIMLDLEASQPYVTQVPGYVPLIPACSAYLTKSSYRLNASCLAVEMHRLSHVP